MRVLVSGGTGLVGRYIVEGLLAQGHAVIVGGRKQPDSSLFSAPVGFTELHLDPGLHQEKVFRGIDAFVHAAFDHLPGRYRGGEGDDPARFRELNLDGSAALFDTAKRFGVARAIFLSSRAVYDGQAHGTFLTEDLPLSPTSLYGEVKLAVEKALAEISSPSFVASSLRSTGVYGGLRPNKWDALIAEARSGRLVPARAGTEVHGRDVASAVCLLLDAEPGRIMGQSFNLSDIVIDTRMILERLDLAGPLPEGVQLAANEMDTAKIRRLGWKPGGMALFEATMRELAGSLKAGN